MKQITIAEIRSYVPCYDPTKYLPENWSGTAIELLDRKDIPFQDRLWVLMRPEIFSEKLMRLFAIWCAKQVQHLMKDQRSLDALDVAERFANGEATAAELSAVADAARDARDAAWAAWAARDAWAAARDARDAAVAAQERKLHEMILAGIETGDTK